MRFASSKSSAARWLSAVIAASCAALLGTVVFAASPVTAAPTWGAGRHRGDPPGRDDVHPGRAVHRQLRLHRRAPRNVYVGYAAHCAGLGAATDTNGCDSATLPVGTAVTFNKGGSLISEGTLLGRGTLAYSSWVTMQTKGRATTTPVPTTTSPLVKVAAADVAKVNPSVPFWGGPVGIDTNGTAAGDQLYTYGNSSLRFGLSQLSPHTGISLGDSAADGGWTHPLYTVTPGVPGDSGSGFLSADGSAVGTLSTLGLAPLPLSNNIGDLAHELAYAQANSGISGLTLVNGTEPFSPLL